MTHTIIVDPNTKIIEITVQGNATLGEIKEIISEALQVAQKERSNLILGDAREMSPRLSTLEIYELPLLISKIYTLAGLEATKFKRAFVVAKKTGDFKFFETVRVNRGHNTRLFFEISKAREWLLDSAAK